MMSRELGSRCPTTLAARELSSLDATRYPSLHRHLPGTFRGTERSICTTGMCSTPGASWYRCRGNIGITEWD